MFRENAFKILTDTARLLSKKEEALNNFTSHVYFSICAAAKASIASHASSIIFPALLKVIGILISF